MKFKTKLITSVVLAIFCVTSVFAGNSAPLAAGGHSADLTDTLSEVQRVAIDGISTFQDTISKAKENSSRINVGILKSSPKKKETTPKESKPKATRPPRSTKESRKSNQSEGKINSNEINRVSLRLRNGVVVSPKIAPKLIKIADKYYFITKKPIYVTSATRSSRSQAVAMKGLINRNGEKYVRKLYRNKPAVGEILSAHRKAGVDGMARAIDGQIERGIFISNHLKNRSIDLASRNTNETALGQAVKSVNGRYSREDSFHFHIDLPNG
jgi:hypothetical protein